jgi:Zn-dependent peptidase ImmA (M78 family)
MRDSVVSVDRDVVLAGVGAVYQAAGLDANYAAAGIALLQKLVAAFPLSWYEVPSLTQKTSATYLRSKMGRPITPLPDRDEPLAGRLYAKSAGGCILVEQTDPLVRRRFTVAHELGHYVLHVLPRLVDGPVVFEEELPITEDEAPDDSRLMGRPLLLEPDGGTTNRITPPQMEAEADLFAAELLMPERLCQELVRSHSRLCGGRRSVLGRRLATECLVSQAAMTRRLRELDLPGVVA